MNLVLLGIGILALGILVTALTSEQRALHESFGRRFRFRLPASFCSTQVLG